MIFQLQKWSRRLQRPVDGSSLAVFRILFGAIMMVQVYKFWSYDLPLFSYPFFHFSFLPFARPFPGNGMHVLMAVMGVAALCIALGLFYRFAALIFFVSYTYYFLLDKILYNNHFYLIALVAFLLIFMEAHRWASLDGLFRPRIATGQVPFWNVFLLRAQFFIVYLFGGIAKLNYDWLHGEPVRHWFVGRFTDVPVMGTLLAGERGVWFFSYGGLLFDLSIGFLLSWKRTRPLAVCGVLFFNLMNNWFFRIGIFPFLMIASTLLFFEPDAPRRFLLWLGKLLVRWSGAVVSVEARRAAPQPVESRAPQWAVLGFVALYLLIQVLVPLRHWLYPGNVAWTEEGHYFSWRMKLRHKTGHIRLMVTDPATNETKDVNMAEDLSPLQITEMAPRPDMIWQYAQFLKYKMQAAGIPHPIIKAETMVILNFGVPKAIIDPNVNLAEVDYPLFGHAGWILSEPAVAKQ